MLWDIVVQFRNVIPLLRPMTLACLQQAYQLADVLFFIITPYGPRHAGSPPPPRPPPPSPFQRAHCTFCDSSLLAVDLLSYVLGHLSLLFSGQVMIVQRHPVERVKPRVEGERGCAKVRTH